MPNGLDDKKGRGWKALGQTHGLFAGARLSTEAILSPMSFILQVQRSQWEIDTVLLHGEERGRWG